VSVLCAVIRFGITQKFWLRASFAVVHELLIHFGYQNEVREWLVIFMRRLLIFLGLSHIRRKYRRRALLVCEMLASLGELHAMWLQQKVIALPSGLASRPVPPYMKCFFQVSAAAADELTLHEFDMFAGASVPLKVFPFDPKRRALLPPPVMQRPGRITVTRSETRLGKKARPLLKRKAAKSRTKPTNSALSQRPTNPGQTAALVPAPEKRLPRIWRTGISLTAGV
jgi:hypothetical protein